MYPYYRKYINRKNIESYRKQPTLPTQPTLVGCIIKKNSNIQFLPQAPEYCFKRLYNSPISSDNQPLKSPKKSRLLFRKTGETSSQLRPEFVQCPAGFLRFSQVVCDDGYFFWCKYFTGFLISYYKQFSI